MVCVNIPELDSYLELEGNLDWGTRGGLSECIVHLDFIHPWWWRSTAPQRHHLGKPDKDGVGLLSLGAMM